MKTFLQEHFVLLKKNVLEKANIIDIAPSDCYYLSLKIQEQTQKSISETTLKRVYQFANHNFFPSVYTLNILSLFVGYSSWNAFISQCSPVQNSGLLQKDLTKEILFNIKKISSYYLNLIRQKSGIPYAHTIERVAISSFLDHFSHTNFPAAVLSAPKGYGKTIGMARWAERQIQLQTNHVLLMDGANLIHALNLGYHVDEWLKKVLQLERSIKIEEFLQDLQEQTLYIVLDNINTDCISPKKFSAILKQLSEMLLQFKSKNNIRFVLLCQPQTIQEYQHIFHALFAGSSLWYFGADKAAAPSTNLPILSTVELQQIFEKLGLTPSYDLLRLSKIKSYIETPLHLQYFYECIQKQPDLELHSYTLEYIIQSQNIYRKILKSVNYLDQINLLYLLVKHSFMENGQILVDKHFVYEKINAQKATYQDLLNAGIIWEIIQKKGVLKNTLIQFKCAVSAAYFLGIKHYENLYKRRQSLQVQNQHCSLAEGLKVKAFKWMLLFNLEESKFDLVDEIAGTLFCPALQEELYRFSLLLFIRLYKTQSIIRAADTYSDPALLRLVHTFKQLLLRGDAFSNELLGLIEKEEELLYFILQYTKGDSLIA